MIGPQYATIAAKVRKLMPSIPFSAVTATSSAAAKAVFARTLFPGNTEVTELLDSPNRSNLFLEVRCRIENQSDKHKTGGEGPDGGGTDGGGNQILSLLRARRLERKCGVIYAKSYKMVKKLAGFLNKEGIKAKVYSSVSYILYFIVNLHLLDSIYCMSRRERFLRKLWWLSGEKGKSPL